MKKKVMHLIGSLKTGGAETLITEYALNFDYDKFEVFIITLERKQNTINEKKLKNKPVQVIHLGDQVLFYNPTNNFKKLINRIHEYILIIKLVNKEQFNIIHTHLAVNSYILPLKIKRKGIKLFHTVHSEVEILFGKRKMIKRLIMKYLLKYKNMTPIAIHSRMKEEFNLLFNSNKCKLIPNAINLDRFQERKYNQQKILKNLKLNKEKLIIGHIGNFSRVKNHEFLIKLFQFIKNKIPESHLVLIGSGRLENQIKKQVSSMNLNESISFLGTRSDIPELLSIMDVFIFPSIFEGFGNVLIEAQAAGVKCIVSDTVPKETHLTDLVTSLSLNDSLETWYKALVSNEKSEKIENQLEKHNIVNVVKQIEDIYIK